MMETIWGLIGALIIVMILVFLFYKLFVDI